MRRIAVLDAPSNLGLRPPTVTSVPGCAKAPGALRDQGLLRRLDARDAGCLTPPRYDPGDWRPGDGVCHAPEIALYSRRLADRIGAILDQGEFPVVLGGDCSIVLGSALAMHRLGEAVGGRIGLIFVDGHSDFRHPGNASYVGAAAGEDLALVTGRGQADLAAIEGRRPYYRDIDVVVMGIRAQDEYRLDLQAAGIVTRPVPTLRVEGAARSAQWAREQLVDCAGYWVHLDVDVLDPAVMPAVDAPEPGGIAFPELEILLAGLVESPHCLGVEITVFDPDYDPDGRYAEEITAAVVAGLKSAHTVDARPDLVAARRDLLAPGAPGKLAPAPAAVAPAAVIPATVGPAVVAPAAVAPAAVVPAAVVPAAVVPATVIPAAVGPAAVVPAAVVPDTETDTDTDWPDAGAGAGRQDAVQERRAAAAADGVALAAAAMSSGGPGTTGDGVAVPATTLAAVAETAEPAYAAAEPSSAAAEQADADAPAERADAERADAAAERADAFAEPALAEPADAERADADAEPAFVDAEPAFADAEAAVADAEPVFASPATVEPAFAEPDAVEPEPDEPEPIEPKPEPEAVEPEVVEAHVVEAEAHDAEVDGEPALRPLGQAPLLDSEPLPATMPGMLRPRPIEDFSLPAQRPAFEIGPEAPADIT